MTIAIEQKFSSQYKQGLLLVFTAGVLSSTVRLRILQDNAGPILDTVGYKNLLAVELTPLSLAKAIIGPI